MSEELTDDEKAVLECYRLVCNLTGHGRVEVVLVEGKMKQVTPSPLLKEKDFPLKLAIRD